ncbi:glycogen debranching protein [Actinoplanes sp. TRM 88003]|uniref:Glycogen debranching protein n=1 Tax=Paractinoplanes aksuensis TaxID=2939490 RepID=A0ABT1DST4_9ACTN|nr:trehalase family glycosidase [Actinoplanes aksuensis]MCO8273892.1 glycogen debranching protein [Actinoplanes aksuensis]
MPGLSFSLRDIPFSYRGSWLDVSPVIAENTYADDLHLVSHQTGLHPVLRLTPVGADCRLVATPSVLSWQDVADPAGRIDLAFQNADTIRVRGAGPGLRLTAAGTLTPFSGSYFFRDPVSGGYVVTSYETGRRYRITLLAGAISEAGGVEALGSADRFLTVSGVPGWEVAIEEYRTARPPFAGPSFDTVGEAAARQFAEFVDAIAPWRSAETPAAELAAYVLWSATVDPAGFLARPGVLMSKHWMDKIWSWDHCFNAIALAAGEPEPAWDQFLLPFDHQDPAGALPDSVTHSEVLHNFVKPPIHGWALSRLREQLGLDRARLTEAYAKLSSWTRFWLDHRRVPGHDLPHYQHGNDSGWDNATTFDGDRVVETADLAAFLVLQLRELAALAEELDRPDDARRWRETAGTVRAAMLDELWHDGRFWARSAASGRRRVSRSLLDLMPIVLGDDLPAEVTDELVTRIAGHLTDHGLATEPPGSPDYAADGYWRGPIWAPSTVLIEDGLRRAGHVDLADTVSRRFRALCERSGFAENFDALTGAGLRDRAYTWTASGYLILAAAHQRRNPAAAHQRRNPAAAG